MSLSTTRNQYLNFNEEPLIEFGVEWPISNSKACFCKLDANFNIHPCILHNNQSSFEWKLDPYFDTFIGEEFSSKCSNDKSEKISRKSNSIENITIHKFASYNENLDYLSSNLHNQRDEIICYPHIHANESFTEILDKNSSNKSKNQSKNINVTRKFKIHKYPNSETRIGVRYDVMNKNFIRAIKRECKRLYCEFLRKKNIVKMNQSLIKK